MDYLIIALVAIALVVGVAFFVFTERDKIAETVADAVDDVATGASNAISHAAKEAAEELDKLRK
ncbi:hypothetical protein LF599_07470 [Pseudodesulfovibrio thermohalotolerans]|uniref:hypothetical protein n=1 Tax=Pseudodesulfovibrio thermohalotolerans TaxID=2880651 RepID=UPI0022B9DDFE|nr:hypothetical protein [Pseudodesulfovibrio thermohalotolerans]WFS63994.1 hypothetical protein LF599_07470 [Pseudodesulfovibrio thermohalotolerans]